MTFIPWLDPIIYILGAIVFLRANYLGFLIQQRVSRHHPDDPRFDFLAVNHWKLVVQRDRELYPSAPHERQRRDVRLGGIAVLTLFAIWVARQIVALKLR